MPRALEELRALPDVPPDLLVELRDPLGEAPDRLGEPPDLLEEPDRLEARLAALLEALRRVLDALRVEPPRDAPARPDALLAAVLRVPPERVEALRRGPAVVRRVAELRLRPVARVLRRRRRPVLARWSRGISALTSAFTSRPSSAPRNFVMRSSSRRIDFANCAVSRSPTSVASVSMRP